MMSKVTISISPELDAALDVAAVESGVNKSRLVETFLRENKAMTPFIEEVRAESRITAYAASAKISSARRGRRMATASSASG